MSALIEEILALRVRVLLRVAQRRRFEANEAVIRDLAGRMTDGDVMIELRRRSSSIWWIFGLFQPRPPP